MRVYPPCSDAGQAEDIKVSIIIQAYNTAEYLPECLDSAVRQSLKQIEIILIDDASTDNSLEIIRNYESLDSRIKSIAFSENKGLGFGRNLAIREAKGTHVMFLDSDDWLETHAVETMYDKAVKQQHDLVMCGFIWHLVHDKADTRRKRAQLPLVGDNDPDFLAYLIQQRKGLSCMSWQFIFLKEMIANNAITFSEGVFFQDVIFTIKAAYYARSIGIVKSALYHYRYRANSAVQFASKKKIRDLRASLLAVREFLEEEGIFHFYQKQYLIRYLQQAVCGAYFDYFKLPKTQSDADLDKYMHDLRTSSLLSSENVLILKNEISLLGEDERDAKDSYRMFYNTLLSLKGNYHYFRFKFKIKYLVIKAWLDLVVFVHNTKKLLLRA